MQAKEALEEAKEQEKKKGLIEKIREKLSRKPKEQSAEVANKEIANTTEEEWQNLDMLQCDTSDSKSSNGGSGSGSSSVSFFMPKMNAEMLHHSL